MAEALRILLAVEFVGLVAWPLLARALPALPDRGFALAKIAGLFALALADGWLAASRLLAELPPAARTAVALALLSAVAGALLAARPSPLPSLRRLLVARWRDLVALELLFLVVFALGLALRAADPGISHTEQPMDRMLLGAVQEGAGWPLEDPWLSGVPLGYYALGHAAVAAPARLAAVRPDVAYNLGIALWGALIAAGASGVAFALARPSLRQRPRAARFAALGGATLLAVSGLAAVRDAWNQLPTLLAGHPGEFWWWWRSSRTLIDRDASGGAAELIHETPAFSWLIGDLHAHFLALPLMLLAAALALELVRRPGRRSAYLVAAGLGGAAIATNTWTLPAVAALLVAAVWSSGDRSRLGCCFAIAGAVVLGGAAVAAPHLVLMAGVPHALVVNVATPSSSATLAALWLPILPSLALLFFGQRVAPGRRRRLAAIAVAWGLAAALAAPLLASWARPDSTGALLRLPVGTASSGPVAALIGRGFDGFALSFVLGAGAAVALALAADASRRPDGRARAAALALAAAGLLLLLAPELVYLRDGHATRLNMVFKSHSSAWPPLLLAALAGAAALAARGRRAWALLAFAPVVASGIYPLAVGIDRLLGATGAPTLDAFAPLAREAPAEAAALSWIRDHVPEGSRVLQAPGASYDPAAVRVSVFTGRPTLLGWVAHEAQWRGAAFGALAAGRESAAAAVYESPFAGRKEATLERFGIDWVYVGPAERAKYEISEASWSALAAIAEVRFERDGVVLFRRRGR